MSQPSRGCGADPDSRTWSGYSAPRPKSGADRAWVTVDAPQPPEALLALLARPERLFRVNPLIEWRDWRESSPGRLRLVGRNLASGRDFALEAVVEPLPDGLRLSYAEGLRVATLLRVEQCAAGSRLVIEDDYSALPECDRQTRLAEVDTSLIPWGQALHPFLARWHRWSRLVPWRWSMDHLWLPLSPSARRIARLLAWVTLGETAVLLLAVAVLAIEGG